MQVFFRNQKLSGSAKTENISDKGVEIVAGEGLEVGDTLELRIVPPGEIFSFTFEGKIKGVEEIKSGDSSPKYKLEIEFIEGLKDFATNMLVGGDERMSHRQSMIIDKGQLECYRAICNFESYPTWQKTIKEVNVFEKMDDGRPEVVEFFMDAILKTVRYVNKYEYFDKDFILSWKSIDGDIKTNEGSYVFQKLRDDRTNAVFTMFVELGFYAPKKIVDYLSNNTMRKSIRALKDVVEKGLIK